MTKFGKLLSLRLELVVWHYDLHEFTISSQHVYDLVHGFTISSQHVIVR